MPALGPAEGIRVRLVHFVHLVHSCRRGMLCMIRLKDAASRRTAVKELPPQLARIRHAGLIDAARLEKPSEIGGPMETAATSAAASEAAADSPAGELSLHDQFTALLRRYNVNDFAASVRVFAVKP